MAQYERLAAVPQKTSLTCQLWIIHVTFYRRGTESTASAAASGTKMGRCDSSRLAGVPTDPNGLVFLGLFWLGGLFTALQRAFAFWFVTPSVLLKNCCLQWRRQASDAFRPWWCDIVSTTHQKAPQKSAKNMTDLPAWLLSAMKRFFFPPSNLHLISNRHAQGHPACKRPTEKSLLLYFVIMWPICDKTSEVYSFPGRVVGGGSGAHPGNSEAGIQIHVNTCDITW